MTSKVFNLHIVINPPNTLQRLDNPPLSIPGIKIMIRRAGSALTARCSRGVQGSIHTKHILGVILPTFA